MSMSVDLLNCNYFVTNNFEFSYRIANFFSNSVRNFFIDKKDFKMLRTCSNLLRNVTSRRISVRTMTHYPIDDVMFGLTEEQSAVSFAQHFRVLVRYQLTVIFN